MGQIYNLNIGFGNSTNTTTAPTFSDFSASALPEWKWDDTITIDFSKTT